MLSEEEEEDLVDGEEDVRWRQKTRGRWRSYTIVSCVCYRRLYMYVLSVSKDHRSLLSVSNWDLQCLNLGFTGISNMYVLSVSNWDLQELAPDWLEFAPDGKILS